MNKKLLLFIVAGAILVLSFVGIFMTVSRNDLSQNKDASGKTAKTHDDPKTIDQFIPDQTTLSQVNNALGKPLRVGEKDRYTILYYRLSDLKRESKVYVLNNRVVYTIEEVSDNNVYLEYKKNHPKIEGVIYNLYNNDADYNLFVYASAGAAFLVHEPTGYTIEKHRFAPTTKTKYFAIFAPALTYE